MYKDQIKVLRNLTFEPGVDLAAGTVLPFNPESDRYIKELGSVSMILREPFTEKPLLVELVVNSDIEILAPNLGEIKKEDLLKMVDFKDNISMRAKLEVDYLVEELFTVVTKYHRQGNPKLTPEEQFDPITRLMLVGRAYNSIIHQHNQACAQVYADRALHRTKQVQTATDIWIDQAHKKIKDSGAPEMEIILEALEGLKKDNYEAMIAGTKP